MRAVVVRELRVGRLIGGRHAPGTFFRAVAVRGPGVGAAVANSSVQREEAGETGADDGDANLDDGGEPWQEEVFSQVCGALDVEFDQQRQTDDASYDDTGHNDGSVYST